MPDSGNDAQVRVMLGNVAESAAKAAILDYKAHQLDAPKEAPLHPLVKWVVGTTAALGLAAMITGGGWLISSVSDMQVTLARMDERQMSETSSQDSRFAEINRRIGRLEAYHEGGGS